MNKVSVVCLLFLSSAIVSKSIREVASILKYSAVESVSGGNTTAFVAKNRTASTANTFEMTVEQTFHYVLYDNDEGGILPFCD